MAGSVRVFNVRKDVDEDGQPEPGETVVMVDRTHKVLGNPFILKNRFDVQARQAVIAAYAAQLAADEAVGGPMSQALDALADRLRAGEDLCLGCHCKPSACHGDVLAQALRARLALAPADLATEGASARPPRL